mgnify:FL=1
MAIAALMLPLVAAAADDEAQTLLRRTADYISSLGRYTARFGITAGEYASQGSYTVDGDAYYIEVDGAEVYCDGKIRREVDNERREVNVDAVDGASRNILDNPTRCFDFVGTDYEAEVSSRTASETTLHLRSRDASVEGDIYLTVETATGRPRHITYVLYDDRIEVAVESLEPSREAVRRYDAKRYSDYETIDFR